MKVASVVGARPQFVKAALVSSALERAGIEELLVHTGQHYDAALSEVFFRELGMREPDRWLGIGSGSHGQQTARMLVALEEVLLEERPRWVIVYGDTNSTLAGALAAVKLCLDVAHVEAGMRSFNRAMPEEVNRILTDRISNLLLAPTVAAARILEGEGVEPASIRLVGDVMLDAFLAHRERALESDVVERLGLPARGYVLATAHRAENTDDPDRLRAIFGGLAGLADRIPVVLPLHPRTREALHRQGGLDLGKLRIVEPVGYLDMLALEADARLVATDSGGVQREAFFHGVPCVTLRDETEWVELIEAGWNRLLPPTDARAVSRGLRDALDAGPPSGARPALYGDGRAAERVVSEIVDSSAT